MSATVIDMSPYARTGIRPAGGAIAGLIVSPSADPGERQDHRLAPPPRRPVSVSADRHDRLWMARADHVAWLVRAPSGYGKTMLLAGAYDSVRARGAAAGWLSCDAAADATLLTAAVRSLVSGTAAMPDPAALVGAIEGEAWLFLDAVDRLADPAAHDLLDLLIRYGPPGLRIVAACRADPPVVFDGLDAQGATLHVGADTLALTEVEAMRLTPDLPRDRIAARWHAVGGWATGLRPSSNGDHAERRIADALDDADRALLTRYAIVGGVDATALDGADRARLATLAAAGGFVVRSGEGYRLLPPLRAALADRLDAATQVRLHRDAATAATARGDVAVAVRHLIRAGDGGAAAAALRDAALPMIRQGHGASVRALAADLPAGTLDAQATAWLAAFADPCCVGDGGPVPVPMLGAAADAETAAFAAAMQRVSDAGAAMAAGDWARAHALVAPLRATAGDAMIVARAAVVTAGCYRSQGQPAEAERVLAATHRQLIADDRAGPGAWGEVAAVLAGALYERGELAAAGALLDTVPVAADDAHREATAIVTQVVRVRCAAERGDVAAAAGAIERAEALACRRDWPRLLAQCIVDRSRLGLPQTTAPDTLLAMADEEAAVAAPGGAGAGIFAILAEMRIYEAMDAGDRPRLNLVCDRLKRLAVALGDAELELKATLFSILPQLSGRCDRMVDLAAVKAINRSVGNGFRRTVTDILTVNGVRVCTELGSASFVPSSFLALVAQVRPANVGAYPAVHGHAQGDELSFLTAREIAILSALASGISNKEMARMLHLTPETVKWHLKNVMRKLGAESRIQAVAHAETLGFDLSADIVEP